MIRVAVQNTFDLLNNKISKSIRHRYRRRYTGSNEDNGCVGNHCRELFKLSKGLFATTEEKTNTSLLDSIG